METRIERYAKYRQEISRMPASCFAPDGSFLGDGEANEEIPNDGGISPSNAKIYVDEDNEKIKAPYLAYLKRRRSLLWLKILVAVLAVIGLILMYILFVRE